MQQAFQLKWHYFARISAQPHRAVRGRINRNLEYKISPVIIFTTAQEYSQPPDSNKRANRTLEVTAMGTDLQSHYSKLIIGV